MAQIPRVALLLSTERTYPRDVLRGIRQYLAANGPWATVIERVRPGDPLPESLQQWSGDGMIVQTTSSVCADALASLSMPKIELLAQRYHSARPFVGCDNREVGRMVAVHFMKSGYDSFACLPVPGRSFFEVRMEGYREALAEAGFSTLRLPPDEEGSGLTYEARLQQWTRALAGIPKPVAVFAANDRAGTRVLDAARRADWAVPGEIAVMGCENDETVCEFADPQMSSVAFDGEAVGREAARYLDQLMQGLSGPEKPLLIPPRGIVVRSSTDEMFRRDALVSRALSLMQNDLSAPQDSATLAQQLGCSRSTLHRRFIAALGRTPKSELTRRRLHLARSLLRNTLLTIDDIAEQVGYSHGTHLQTAFRRLEGLTPGEYRKRRIQ